MERKDKYLGSGRSGLLEFAFRVSLVIPRVLIVLGLLLEFLGRALPLLWFATHL